MSERILDERKKGEFKDCSDVIVRVKGVGEGNAARFTAGGLTVDGSPYAGKDKAAVAPSAATTTTKAEPKR